MKRRIALIAFLLLAGGWRANAQIQVQGAITTGASTCALKTTCVVDNLQANAGAVSFSVSGTYSGTLQFEVSTDGTNFVAVNAFPPNSTTAATSTTSTGTWTASVVGMIMFRVRCSSYSSGTAQIAIQQSKSVAGNLGGGSSGGGDTVTSPNSTLNVGGTGTNTSLDLAGSAGEIMAGATPSLTYTPTLGVSGTAGTLAMFPATGNFTTTWGSAATASNTILGFVSVPTTGDAVKCTASSTTCTLADAGGPIPSTLANTLHKWLNSYTQSTGAFTQTQPNDTDLAGTTAGAELYIASSAVAELATTAYSVKVSGATNPAWATPTANGQCFMSGASSYATTTPSFQACASGSIGGSATVGYEPVMVTNTTTITTSPCDHGISTANTYTCSDSAGIAVAAIKSTGAIGVGATPPTACGSATGCFAVAEASGTGTPTAGQDLMRGNSTTHSFECSLNNGAEAPCNPSLPTSATSGHLVTWGTWPAMADGGAVPVGTVTSIATTAPLGGGTITASGTLTCTTCVTYTTPATGIARSASGSQNIAGTELSGDATTSGSNAVSLAAPFKVHTCEIVIGGTGASNVLQTGDDGIAAGSCYNGYGVTITITGVYCLADTGTTTTVTPIVHGGGTILSGALTCGNNAMSSTGTLSGTPTLTTTQMVDGAITAVGTAHDVHIIIKYTVPNA